MKISLENASQLAKNNLKEIRTVKEWANRMGYNSSKYFSKEFKKFLGISPKKTLIRLRIEKFHELIQRNSKMSCFEIGCELGIGDEQQLNQYVKYHTNKNPTWWKNRK